MSELRLFDNEYNCIIAGVDEAGRGPLAGPVVAAAVIIEDYFEELEEINDSKKLTEKKRENASIPNIKGLNKRIYLLPKMYN